MLVSLQEYLGLATIQTRQRGRLVWNVHNTQHCHSLAKSGKSFKLRSYTFVGPIGVGGSTIAVHIVDITDRNNPVDAVLKFTVAKKHYFREIGLHEAMMSALLDGRRCQNIPRLLDHFECAEIPEDWMDAHTMDSLKKYAQRFPDSALGCSVTTLGTLGSLHSFIEHAVFAPVDIACFAFQLLFTVANFAQFRLLHRDMKSYNVVLQSHNYTRKRIINRIKYFGPAGQCHMLEFDPYAPQTAATPLTFLIIDYDNSQTSSVDVGKARQPIGGQVTSVTHRAPEFFFLRDGEVRYTHKSDVFSTGVIILEMVILRTPFMGLFRLPIVDKSKSFQSDFDGWMKNSYPQMHDPDDKGLAATVLWHMLEALGIPSQTYDEHPLMSFISFYQKHGYFKHAQNGGWLRNDSGAERILGTDGLQLLLQMLSWDPNERPTAHDSIVKHHAGFFAPLVSAAKTAIAELWASNIEYWGYEFGWLDARTSLTTTTRHLTTRQAETPPLKDQTGKRRQIYDYDDHDKGDILEVGNHTVSRNFVQLYSTSYKC